MIYKVSMLIILLIIFMFWMYEDRLVRKLASEYRGDERWINVKLMAGNATKRYFQYTIILVLLLELFNLFSSSVVTVRLDSVGSFFLLVVVFGNVIEDMAILHFDKRM